MSYVVTAPDRRKRNVGFVAVEQGLLEMPSTEQEHQQTDDEQKHSVEQRDEEKCQVQCLN